MHTPIYGSYVDTGAKSTENQRLNRITALTRESWAPKDILEKLKVKRQAAQDFIHNGVLAECFV